MKNKKKVMPILLILVALFTILFSSGSTLAKDTNVIIEENEKVSEMLDNEESMGLQQEEKIKSEGVAIQPIKSGRQIVDVGGIPIDLTQDTFNINNANDDFINALMTQPLTFEKECLFIFSGSSIYGTPQNPFKKVYNSNLNVKAPSGAIDILFREQKTRELDSYRFINKVPESIKLPVPFYLEEGEANREGWSYEGSSQSEGYTNTTVKLNELRSLFIDGKEYLFESKLFPFHPLVTYSQGGLANGAYTKNAMTWKFNTKMNVEYTVDIAPITNGGTPTLDGLTSLNEGETVESNLSTVNNEFWRNGDINVGVDGGSYTSNGVSASSYGSYGDAFTADAGVEAGYEVAFVNVKTYDSKTGDFVESKTYRSMDEYMSIAENTKIKGKTEIRVAYKKAASFTKADDLTKNPLTQNQVEFTVYEDSACTKVIGKSSYDDINGKVSLPAVTMPIIGNEENTYYMKETKAPINYKIDETVYTIKLDKDGKFTIQGKNYNQQDNTLYNTPIGDLIITKVNNKGNVNDTFEFKVSLGKDNQPYMGTYVLNGVEKKYTGPFKVSLKGGEKVILGQITEGTAYLVEEAKYSDYTSSSVNADGIIKKGENQSDFVNTYIEKLPFSFTKTDEHGVILPNAHFTLYNCENTTVGHKHDEMFTSITKDCWKEYADKYSGANGIVDFGTLVGGEYQLVETKAPSGYQTPIGQWKIIVDIANADIKIEAKGSNLPPAFTKNANGIWSVMNYKNFVLPLTGGSSTLILLVGGLGTLAMALVYRRRIFKEKK